MFLVPAWHEMGADYSVIYRNVQMRIKDIVKYYTQIFKVVCLGFIFRGFYAVDLCSLLTRYCVVMNIVLLSCLSRDSPEVFSSVPSVST